MKTMSEQCADEIAFWSLIGCIALLAVLCYLQGYDHKMNQITQAERLAVYCREEVHNETLCQK